MLVDVVNGADSWRASGTVVIVDVFRSSSAITTALANGAEAVIPFPSIRDAIRFRNSARHRTGIILAGERRGITPRGFDCNISPLDMTRERVQGKAVVYSSTNLTRILGKLQGRMRIIVGGFNNAKAVADYLRPNNTKVTVVACGSRHGPTIEDVTGAGAIVHHLHAEQLTDRALIALGLYRNPDWRAMIEKGRIAPLVRELGFGKDIEFCLSTDTTTVVPGLVGKKIVVLSSS